VRFLSGRTHRRPTPLPLLHGTRCRANPQDWLPPPDQFVTRHTPLPDSQPHSSRSPHATSRPCARPEQPRPLPVVNDAFDLSLCSQRYWNVRKPMMGIAERSHGPRCPKEAFESAANATDASHAHESKHPPRCVGVLIRVFLDGIISHWMFLLICLLFLTPDSPHTPRSQNQRQTQSSLFQLLSSGILYHGISKMDFFRVLQHIGS
jgi:hypothetical protein